MKQTINSKLILASKNAATGVVLYTFVWTYPRMVLAEVNTHRMLSRNSASSRAIPVKVMRKRILSDPFVPLSIGQNQKGMQAGKEIEGWRRTAIESIWKLARYPQVFAGWLIEKLGAHKQLANRLTEAWMWTEQLVTATDMKNLILLRDNEAAEPHFHELARQAALQIEHSNRMFMQMQATPGCNSVMDAECKWQILQPGEWHRPFTRNVNWKEVAARLGAEYIEEGLNQISAARSGRVSYFLPNSDKVSDIDNDIALAQKLSKSGHWSPFEHVAQAVETDMYIGNFRSWKQYRKSFFDEAGGDR